MLELPFEHKSDWYIQFVIFHKWVGWGVIANNFTRIGAALAA